MVVVTLGLRSGRQKSIWLTNMGRPEFAVITSVF